MRRIDDVFLIDSSGNIILSDISENINFVKPGEDEFNLALEGEPVQLIRNQGNQTSAMIKLNSLIDTYLYI